MRASVVVGCAVAVVGVILLLVVAGGAGYWYYTTTPGYSLRQIAEAVKDHDVESFHKHVDVDALCDSAVQAALDESSHSPARNGWEAAGRGLGTAFLSVLRPQIVANVKREIDRAIERGPDSEKRHWQVRPRTVERQGKVATAQLDVEDLDKSDHAPIRIVVRMRDKGGYWQVFEIVNLPELMRSGQLGSALPSGSEP